MKKLLGQEFRAGVGAWLAAGMVGAGAGAGLGFSTSIVDEEILETPARSSAQHETVLPVDRAEGAL